MASTRAHSIRVLKYQIPRGCNYVPSHRWTLEFSYYTNFQGLIGPSFPLHLFSHLLMSSTHASHSDSDWGRPATTTLTLMLHSESSLARGKSIDAYREPAGYINDLRASKRRPCLNGVVIAQPQEIVNMQKCRIGIIKWSDYSNICEIN